MLSLRISLPSEHVARREYGPKLMSVSSQSFTHRTGSSVVLFVIVPSYFGSVMSMDSNFPLSLVALCHIAQRTLNGLSIRTLIVIFSPGLYLFTVSFKGISIFAVSVFEKKWKSCNIFYALIAFCTCWIHILELNIAQSGYKILWNNYSI